VLKASPKLFSNLNDVDVNPNKRYKSMSGKDLVITLAPNSLHSTHDTINK